MWLKAAKSPYQPYLLEYLTGTPEQLQSKWNEIIATYPDHPIAEMLRLASARVKAYEARNAMTRGASARTSQRQTDEARAELQILATSGRHELVRLRARHELAQMKTTVAPPGE